MPPSNFKITIFILRWINLKKKTRFFIALSLFQMIFIYKFTGGIGHCFSGLGKCLNERKKGQILVLDCQHWWIKPHQFEQFFTIVPGNNVQLMYDGVEKRLNGTELENVKKWAPRCSPKRPKGCIPHKFICDGKVIFRKSIASQQPNVVWAGCGYSASQYALTELRLNPTFENQLLEKVALLPRTSFCVVHYRNTDKQGNLKEIHESIQSSKFKTFYLATDDWKALDILKKRHAQKTFVQLTKPMDQSACSRIKGTHYQNSDKMNEMTNALIDLFAFAVADDLIMSKNSTFSQMGKWVNHFAKNGTRFLFTNALSKYKRNAKR